ncbi:MAG: hypothetical protein AMS19_14985 [Gemmatimonas sp. SG8_23]|nr:MAG: hypothetical protein AMS19_14985 [Gemmatimonas sp. SG8_23]
MATRSTSVGGPGSTTYRAVQAVPSSRSSESTRTSYRPNGARAIELQAEDGLRVGPQLAFDALDLDVNTHGRAGFLGEGRSRHDGGDDNPEPHSGKGDVECSVPAWHEDLEPLPRRVGRPPTAGRRVRG